MKVFIVLLKIIFSILIILDLAYLALASISSHNIPNKTYWTIGLSCLIFVGILCILFFAPNLSKRKNDNP